MQPLHHNFIEIAKRYARKIAIVDRTTEKRVSYSKSLIGAFILARRVRKMKDCYIGIMVPTSAGAFLSVIGTVMTGKVPVMINYSTGAADNCKYARNKIGFNTIITSRALLKKISCPHLEGMVYLEDIMESVGIFEKIRTALRIKLPVMYLKSITYQARPDDTAVILFTSGSEKEPKAVELTHRNINANIVDIIDIFNLSSDEVVMSILPLFHVFGHTVIFWMPVCVGMTAVTYANPLDFKKIPSIIRRERATLIAGTPAFFAGYLREASAGDLDSLRIIVAGADKVQEWLRNQYLQKHGKVLLEGYGTTETSPVISANTPTYNKPGSIGKPLGGVQVRIVDLQSGQALPSGKEGKIMVKGDLVMKGYFDDVEETLLHIKDGWYDTGDMGVLDAEGYLWHRGRLKRFVKIGGEMVSMVNIENAMQKCLPEGVSCCVVEIPDAMKGARLVAAVTGDGIDEGKIIRELTKLLPRIAVPKKFIHFDELPRMGSGKIDFRTTAEMVRQHIASY